MFRARHGLIGEGARDHAILTADEKGRVRSRPAGAAAVFGWSEHGMPGADCARTFTPGDRAAGQPTAELAMAARDGVAPDLHWHERLHGRRIFIEGAVLPLREKDGTPRGVISPAFDRHPACGPRWMAACAACAGSPTT